MDPPDNPTKNVVSYADAVRRPKSQPSSPWSTSPRKDSKWDQVTNKKKKSSKAGQKKCQKGNWRTLYEPETESTEWTEPAKPTISTSWDPAPIRDAEPPPKATFSYAEALKRKAFTPVLHPEDKSASPKQDPEPTLPPLAEVALPKIQPERAKARQVKGSASAARNDNKLGDDVSTFQGAKQGSVEETQQQNTKVRDRKQSATATRRNQEQKLENSAGTKQPGISIRYDQTHIQWGKEAIRFNAPAGSDSNRKVKNDDGLQHGARQGSAHATIYRPPPPAFPAHSQLNSTTPLNATQKNSIYSGKKPSANMQRSSLTAAWLPSRDLHSTPASPLPRPTAMRPPSIASTFFTRRERRNSLAHPFYTANAPSRTFPSPLSREFTTPAQPDDTISEACSEPTTISQAGTFQMDDRRKALIDLHDRGDISLWDNQYDSDVSIECQGYFWKVHRDIICRDSDWFKEKLAATGKGDKRYVSLDCSEVDPMQFANALHYMYQDAPHRKQMRMRSPLDGEPLAHAVFNYICGAAVDYQPMQDAAVNALYDAALQLHVFFHQTPTYVLRHLSLSTLYKPLALALTIVFEQGPRKNMHSLRVVMAHLCDVSLMWMVLNEGFQREIEKEWMPKLMLNVVRDSIWFGGSDGVLADLFEEMQLAANERLEKHKEKEKEHDFEVWNDRNDGADSSVTASEAVDPNSSTSGSDWGRPILDGETRRSDGQSEDSQPPQIILEADVAEAGAYELWRDNIGTRTHSHFTSGPWRVPRSIIDPVRNPGGTYLDTHLASLITREPPTDIDSFDPTRNHDRASAGDDASQLDEDGPEPASPSSENQTTTLADDVDSMYYRSPFDLLGPLAYHFFR
ncbi:hypothetical protein B0J18DRAFT_246731 [Chaetomium sp. MPI-SDFR-AT-0129]|nr:hypothetical protein B0J18DRAFT_246731 [Chaetomium sp. MPI-SDFR-AT-0129]